MLANAVMLAIHNVHKYPTRKKQQLTGNYWKREKNPPSVADGTEKERHIATVWVNDRNGSSFVCLVGWFEATMYCMFNSYRAVVCDVRVCVSQFVCSISHFITEQIEPLDSCFVPYFVLPLDRFPELVDKHVLLLLSLFALVLLLLLFPHCFFRSLLLFLLPTAPPIRYIMCVLSVNVYGFVFCPIPKWLKLFICLFYTLVCDVLSDEKWEDKKRERAQQNINNRSNNIRNAEPCNRFNRESNHRRYIESNFELLYFFDINWVAPKKNQQ